MTEIGSVRWTGKQEKHTWIWILSVWVYEINQIWFRHLPMSPQSLWAVHQNMQVSAADAQPFIRARFFHSSAKNANCLIQFYSSQGQQNLQMNTLVWFHTNQLYLTFRQHHSWRALTSSRYAWPAFHWNPSMEKKKAKNNNSTRLIFSESLKIIQKARWYHDFVLVCSCSCHAWDAAQGLQVDANGCLLHVALRLAHIPPHRTLYM